MSKTIFTILLVICTVVVLAQTKSVEPVNDESIDKNEKTDPTDEANDEALKLAVKEINEMVDNIKLLLSNVTPEKNTEGDSFNGPEAKRMKRIVGKIVFTLLKLMARMARAVGRVLAAAAVTTAIPLVG